MHKLDPEKLAGSVALIGAGPGDPELLTLRAHRLLGLAEVVLYDQLVSAEVLAHCPPSARRIDVGKRARGPRIPQAETNAMLVREAQAGNFVVRIKGGDPFVFGRGGEEALALVEAGVAFEVVPGISSALAGPAAAAIPVTHRRVATSVSIVTAMSAGDDEGLRQTWSHLARAGGTLVVLMGVGALPRLVEVLREAGRADQTPVAVVERATTPRQRVVRGTLADIAERVRAEGVRSPATIVVGEVVALGEMLETARVKGATETETLLEAG